MFLALRSLYESSGPPAVTGTGAVTLALTVAASGQQKHSGTGTLTIRATLNATGQQKHIGTGALALAPTIAATGQQKHLGTGAITLFPNVAASGLVGGGSATSGSGALTLDFSITGTGELLFSGDGNLALTPTIDGLGTVVNPEPEVGTYSPGGASSGRTRGRKTRSGLSPWEVQHDEQAAEVATPEPALPGTPSPLGTPTWLAPIEAQPWETPEPVSIPAVSRVEIDALLGIAVPDDDEEAILLLLESE